MYLVVVVGRNHDAHDDHGDFGGHDDVHDGPGDVEVDDVPVEVQDCTVADILEVH